jgi:hypothetical protein
LPALQNEPITLDVSNEDFARVEVKLIAEASRYDHSTLRANPNISVLCHVANSVPQAKRQGTIR